MSYAGILEMLHFLWSRYRKEKVKYLLGEVELVTMNVCSQKEEVKCSYVGEKWAAATLISENFHRSSSI